MDLYKLILKRRSIRLFKQKKVPLSIIKKSIDAARLAPSAANLQFIEYLIVDDKVLRDKIFALTRWAGYLWPKRVPPKDKRPTAYIIILINNKKTKNPDLRDIGAASQSIILSLLYFGLGTCWIASIDRAAIRKLMKIPRKFEIDSVIAIGYADEAPKLETSSKNVKYWLDKRGRLHVPKRPLKSIVHHNRTR
jgi:nitroreductase